jgi:hypothetical protein
VKQLPKRSELISFDSRARKLGHYPKILQMLAFL